MTEQTVRGVSGAALRRWVSAISLGAAAALIVVKLWGWMATGSVALLTSAADGVVDALSAMATFLGVRFAQHPADSEHRFGHGKGEALAAFTQAILLAAAALLLAAQSCWRLISPQPLVEVTLGIWVAAGGLATSGILAGLQTWVLRRSASTAIAADRTHYSMDAVLNVGVLAALLLTRATGWQRADPLIALVITAYMIHGAYQVALSASRQLLDEELPQAQRERIEAAALACPGARRIHGLRTRDAGDRAFVEFTLEVDGHLSVREGHEIVDAAERAIAALSSKETEVIGHLEPWQGGQAPTRGETAFMERSAGARERR